MPFWIIRYLFPSNSSLYGDENCSKNIELKFACADFSNSFGTPLSDLGYMKYLNSPCPQRTMSIRLIIHAGF